LIFLKVLHLSMSGLCLLIVLFVLICLAQQAYAKVEAMEFSDGTFLYRFVAEDLDFLLALYLSSSDIAEKNKCRWVALASTLSFGGVFSFVACMPLFGNSLPGWGAFCVVLGIACFVTLGIVFCCPFKVCSRLDIQEKKNVCQGYLTEAEIHDYLATARNRYKSIIGEREFFFILERPYPANGTVGPDACFLAQSELAAELQADQFASTIRDMKNKLAAAGITEKKRGNLLKKHSISPYPAFLDVFGDSGDVSTTAPTTVPPPTVAGVGPAPPTAYPVAPAPYPVAPAPAGYAPPQVEQPSYPTAPAYDAQADNPSGRGYNETGDTAIEMGRTTDRTV